MLKFPINKAKLIGVRLLEQVSGGINWEWPGGAAGLARFNGNWVVIAQTVLTQYLFSAICESDSPSTSFPITPANNSIHPPKTTFKLVFQSYKILLIKFEGVNGVIN